MNKRGNQEGQGISHQMGEPLLRQRKLLIGISLAIIFLRAGEVKLGKISIAGNTVSIENPQGFYLIIWVIFAYLCLRYYQYLRQEEEGDFDIIQIFWDRMDLLSNAQLVGCANSQIPDHMATAIKPWQGDMVAFSRLERRISYVWCGHIPVPPKGEFVFKVYLIRFVPHFLRALRYALLNSSQSTDYYLPLLLPWGALIYGAFGSWEGSLFNVVQAIF